MALFDLNSRYTKSMQNGGSYEREASIGGYNRKELRGLNKQARRGTLTQRERARLKYLTDERKGRRKRGLLSGLGGAAATLGALAAAGKLGEGKGGAALMDAIKLRLAEGKDKAKDKLINAKDKLELLNDKRLAKKLGVDPREYVDDSPASAVTEDVSSDMQLPRELRDTPGADIIRDVQGGGEMTRRVDEMTERSNEDIENEAKLEAERQARLARRPEFASGSNLDPYLMPDQRQDEFIPQGPIRGGMVPGPEGRSDTPGSHVQQALLEIARDEASRVSSENPLPTGITSTRRNTGSEVTGLRSRSVDLGSDFPAEIPANPGSPLEPDVDQYPAPNRAGASPTRGSNRPNVRKLLNALNRSKPSEIDVDPEGIASSPAMAKQVLAQLNRRREQIGLKPVESLSEEVLQETQVIDNHLQRKKQGSGTSMPRGPVAGQPQGPRALVDQILNRYN